MRRPLAAILLVAATLCVAPEAFAANSTEAPPSDASKEGGIAGDTHGAIRALGGTTQNDFKPSGNVVDVPRLGGTGSNSIGGPPAGTTGR